MKKRIWKQEILNSYELDVLTPLMVEQAEEKMGYALPQSYVDLLLEQNGGSLYLNRFPLENYEEGYMEVDYLWGIDKNGKQGICKSKYLIEEWELPKNLIILNGDGNNWIALDYRQNSSNPSVLFLENESNIEITLAKDFKIFISELYRDEGLNDFESVIFDTDKTEYTVEEADVVFAGDTIGDISLALYHFSKVNPNIEWFLNKIEELLRKRNGFIVMEAEGALMELILNRTDEIPPYLSKIEKMLEIVNYHRDPEVKKFAKKIEQQLKL